MKKQKDGKRANNKRPYIGPRVTVLSPKSAQAKELVDDVGSDSGSKGQDSDAALTPEPAKAKKRSA